VHRCKRGEEVGTPVREVGSLDQRGVGDSHPVVQFVAFAQAAQDAHSLCDGRLVHEHLLEAALQRRVLLDVLPVLVQRRCTYAAQLAAAQHRLEQVARVHRAARRARAHDRVDLVDEQDDAAPAVRHLLDHCLEPVLKLPAVLGACV
jgi:hypothetical protein